MNVIITVALALQVPLVKFSLLQRRLHNFASKSNSFRGPGYHTTDHIYTGAFH